VVVGTYDGRDAAVWIVDLAGRAAPLHLTLTGRNRFPIWTAGGDRVAFQSDREGDLGIWWHRADGSGMTERLTKAEPGEVHIPNAWSPVDLETFLFTVGKADKFSLWTYSLKTRKATPFGVESSAVPDSAFSPDGRWVAYSRRGVNGLPLRGTFLQPFPYTGETRQVVDFGAYLAWSREGKELFIFDSTTVAWSTVSVTSRPSLTFGNPVPLAFPLTAVLFAARGGNVVPRNWDVSPLNDRLIGMARVEALQPQIHVVLNWFEELRQRVPTK
jgi:Tol biopolymer transport system component